MEGGRGGVKGDLFDPHLAIQLGAFAFAAYEKQETDYWAKLTSDGTEVGKC